MVRKKYFMWMRHGKECCFTAHDRGWARKPWTQNNYLQKGFKMMCAFGGVDK